MMSVNIGGVGLTLASSLCQYAAPAAPLTTAVAPATVAATTLLRAAMPVFGESMPRAAAFCASILCFSATIPAMTGRSDAKSKPSLQPVDASISNMLLPDQS